MGFRDLMFWVNESKLKVIRDEIRELHQQRIATLADQESFSRTLNELEQRLTLLSAGKSEADIAEMKRQDSWDDLTSIAGGN